MNRETINPANYHVDYLYGPTGPLGHMGQEPDNEEAISD